MKFSVTDEVYYKGAKAKIVGALDRETSPKYFLSISGVSFMVNADDPNLKSKKEFELAPKPSFANQVADTIPLKASPMPSRAIPPQAVEPLGVRDGFEPQGQNGKSEKK